MLYWSNKNTKKPILIRIEKKKSQQSSTNVANDSYVCKACEKAIENDKP